MFISKFKLCSLMQTFSGHLEGGSCGKIETRTLWVTRFMQDLDGDVWKDWRTKEIQWSWTVDSGHRGGRAQLHRIECHNFEFPMFECQVINLATSRSYKYGHQKT